MFLDVPCLLKRQEERDHELQLLVNILDLQRLDGEVEVDILLGLMIDIHEVVVIGIMDDHHHRQDLMIDDMMNIDDHRDMMIGIQGTDFIVTEVDMEDMMTVKDT